MFLLPSPLGPFCNLGLEGRGRERSCGKIFHNERRVRACAGRGAGGQGRAGLPHQDHPSDLGDANGRNVTGDIVNGWRDWVKQSFCSWDLRQWLFHSKGSVRSTSRSETPGLFSSLSRRVLSIRMGLHIISAASSFPHPPLTESN